MFPIRDHNPSGRTPYMTYALIAVNVSVFALYWLTITSDRDLAWFFYNWGLVPDRFLAGQRPQTIVTSMFLHGGWMHLAGNMLFLWIFGDNLEDELGHTRFLGFYLLSGLAAGAAQVASDYASPVPMVGASGAIAGIMGGYLLLFYAQLATRPGQPTQMDIVVASAGILLGYRRQGLLTLSPRDDVALLAGDRIVLVLGAHTQSP